MKIVVKGTILTDGKNCWRVQHTDKFAVWVKSYPDMPNEVAIPFMWALVDTLKLAEPRGAA
jgi:hypothetical protein